MSNYHLRDPNLSNKARGLLSTMLSLPDNWDYTTRGLAKICKDGVDGITAQLKELEQYGYLVRHRIRDSNGRITDMEYIIYERPHTASPDTEKPYMVKPDMALPRLESLMMSNRPKEPKNARNKNVLVIGGSGSGKTRFFLKPNLMQLHSSYVVTDPKGSVVCEVGKLLERNNYRIKIFNTINFKKSMHYNPFAYIHSEKDILKLVTTLIDKTPKTE